MFKGGDETATPTSTPTASVSTSATPSASVSPSSSVTPSVSVTPLVSAKVSVGVTAPKTVTIIYTDKGYEPANVTIKKGDTVKYVNNSTKEMWPASAMHPTHNAYPEAGGCLGSKFDACARLAIGKSYSFTFNQVGAWGYHDHITPNFFGKITVTN